MAPKTIYVVVSFRQAEDAIEAEAPRIYHSAQAAEAAAKILAPSRLGVIAWACSADPAAHLSADQRSSDARATPSGAHS